MTANALIISGHGTNREHDAANALKHVGAHIEISHINALKNGSVNINDYQLIVIAGGFSYGDALGAGKLLAIEMMHHLRAELTQFIKSKRPVIGICNGFQILLKSGLLQPLQQLKASESANLTLTHNQNHLFECRWVELIAPPSKCIWTAELQQSKEILYCPVAHGEGRLLSSEESALSDLTAAQLVALRYAHKGVAANGAYPYNPNGSLGDIAGICNAEGNILGLMPHPENNILVAERNDRGGLSRSSKGSEAALSLWRSGVNYAQQF